jgi:hypothetical protein
MPGTTGDLKIYDEQFFSGINEVLQQQGNVFNAASNNALIMRARAIKGFYSQQSFQKLVADLIERRDPGSTGTVIDKKIEQDELVSVKMFRRIGPVANTIHSWKTIGENPEIFSLSLGQQYGVAVLLDYVNTVIRATSACMRSEPANMVHDYTSAGNLHTKGLIQGLSKMGDGAGRIVCWVMHSKAFFDLMESQYDDAVFQVASTAVMAGTPTTIQRPVVVTDSPALVLDQGVDPDHYLTLGLTTGAGTAEESEDRDIVLDTITGHENLMARLQGEYAFNMGVSGFQWLTAAGTNPTDIDIGDPDNWDFQYHDHKMGPGIAIEHT